MSATAQVDFDPRRSDSEIDTTLEPTKVSRRQSFDILKGIGITEVILHHCLSHGARKFTTEYGPEWWTLRILNRFLHFAIPLFLLVSAYLLTQSLLKRPDWGRFMRRRFSRSLLPYLIWSLFYFGFRFFVLKVGSDVFTTSFTYPVIGTLTGPRLLIDLPGIARDLFWGKAYFHLYFMVVLLQMSIVLPLLVVAVRNIRIGFVPMLMISALAQLAVYLLQAHVLRIATPASVVFWYIPSILIGVWIAKSPEEWSSVWKRGRRKILLAMVAGFALYLYQHIELELGRPVTSMALNSAFVVYTISISLLLLGLAPSLEGKKFGHFFAKIGQLSLPMFLIHPAILYLLSGPKVSRVLDAMPVSVLVNAGFVFILSYLFAILTRKLRLDRILFGQELPKPKRARSQ